MHAYARVLTFQHHGRPVYFAHGSKGRYVSSQQPHCTRAVAFVLARRTFSYTLTELRQHYGREIGT